MAGVPRRFEIRCPVHGFIALSAWEREIIAQPSFQRLRRIRQLGWTDQVYPGAMHTRFEHSLGVMHVATRMYDAIVSHSGDLLREELNYDDAGLARDRIRVRLAALLHDVGHAPFSHAAEELLPVGPDGSRFAHEDYSAAVIRLKLRTAIEDHPENQNYGFRADDVADLLEGRSTAGRSLFWRPLITGQMDADRLDYLLRDSLHCGVAYGQFDWLRLVHSLRVVRTSEDLRLGVEEGGFHAAESLILARYFMFTQVYLHKTRVAFDHHLQEALVAILPDGRFPAPVEESLGNYLNWDDWRVLGILADGQAGEHGNCLRQREHVREVYHTPETPTPHDLEKFDEAKKRLREWAPYEVNAEKSWYKVGETDIPVAAGTPGAEVRPLSQYSSVIASMKPIGKRMLFVGAEHAQAARARMKP